MIAFNKNIILIVLQSFLGFVFISSGSVKLADLNTFYKALVNFNLFSNKITDIIKYAIPLGEIVLGVFIIFNFSSSLPSLLSSFLLSLFTALIAAKLFEGAEISCGCFGNYSNDKLDFYSVLRNLLLILVSLIIVVLYESRKYSETKISKGQILKIIKIIFLTNLIFYLSVQNIIFALQNNGLKSRLNLLMENETILQTGDIVNNFQIYSLDKTNVFVKYSTKSAKSTILFLLKPTCSPCKINLQNWENLFNRVDTNSAVIYPISLDKFESTLKYTVDNKVSFPVYYVEDKEFLINYKAFLTPQTILIDHNAKVVKVWKGVLDKNQIDEIINLIN